MNKVFLIGRLTKEPEIRSTSTGKKVASFSIAVNEGKDANGQEMVQYFNLSAWDRLAEIVEQYVNKGVKIAVIGSLKNRSWEGTDGVKKYATDITVREMEILSSRGESTGSSESSQTMPTGDKPTAKSGDKNPNQEGKSDYNTNNLPEINVDDINIQMPF